MEQLSFHTEQRVISKLMPFEHNPRKMTEEQIRHLSESLQKFGMVEIPVIDIDNRIVAGHQRLKVMMMIGKGEEMVDVRVPNRKMTDDEFKEYLVRSNKNTGEWDFDMLANVFNANELVDWGFTYPELGLNDLGKDAIDTDSLADTLDVYLNSEIKQIVLYFKGDKFKEIIDRMDKVMNYTSTTNHSESFEAMLTFFEENNDVSVDNKVDNEDENS